MQPKLILTSQQALRISLLIFLVACGKPNGEMILPEHKIDSNQKTTSQKLRQQCYSKVTDRTISDSGGVKICMMTSQGAGKASYKKSNLARKFKMSKQTLKDSSIQEKVTVNAGIEFVNPNINLSPTQKSDIKDMIVNQCLANLQYFWSKSDVSIALNLKVADGSSVDQTLTLDFQQPKAPQASSSPSSLVNTLSGSDLNYQLKIDEWAQGPVFNTQSTKDCNDKADALKDVTIGQKEQFRSECMKETNQLFCLAVNKMLGHWLGAVDASDLNCPVQAAVNDSKGSASPVAAPTVATPTTATPPVVVDESNLKSFMSLPVNPVSLAVSDVQTPVPAAAPAKDVPAPKTTVSTPVAPLAGAIISEDNSDYEMANLAALAAVTDEAVDAKTPKLNPAVLADTVADQSKDPSYVEWLKYTVTKDDLALIFNCDMTQPPPKAPPQGPKVAPAKAPAQNNQKPKT